MTQQRPERHIVSDLHQVIELRARTDYGVAGGTTIDRRIGTDLNVIFNDDTAELRHRQKTRLGRRETISLLTDPGPGVSLYTRAQQGVTDAGVHPNSTVGPDHRAAVNDCTGPDTTARSDRDP